MQRHRERHRDPQPQRRGELHRRHAPAIEKAVQRGRDDQRRREAVQLGVAGVVVVVVRAGGAHGIGVSVDQQQQAVPSRQQDRGSTSHPSSATSSGSSPNTATPNRTPALSGTTTRARRRIPVSHSPERGARYSDRCGESGGSNS